MIAALFVFAGAVQEPAELVGRAEAAVRKPWNVRNRELAEIEDQVAEYVESGKAQTASDFATLARAVGVDEGVFAGAQLRHEYLLMAVALGDAPSAKRLGESWDSLRVGTGRSPRLGRTLPKGAIADPKWTVRTPAAKNVAKALKNPDAYRATLAGVADNAEIKKIRDEDQAVRQRPFSAMTDADLMKMMQEDRKRLARIKDLVRSGRARTGADFTRAALVAQHGAEFEDFALAHELCLAALAIGYRDAIWLAGASYDRMLLNGGYGQRFGSQLSTVHLERMPRRGMTDTIRKAIAQRTVAEAMELARQFEGGTSR